MNHNETSNFLLELLIDKLKLKNSFLITPVLIVLLLSVSDIQAQSDWQAIHSGGDKWFRIDLVSGGLGLTSAKPPTMWKGQCLHIQGSLFKPINRIGFGIGFLDGITNSEWSANKAKITGLLPISLSCILFSRYKTITYDEYEDKPYYDMYVPRGYRAIKRTLTGNKISKNLVSPVISLEARSSIFPSIFHFPNKGGVSPEPKYLDISIRATKTYHSFDVEIPGPHGFTMVSIAGGIIIREISDVQTDPNIGSMSFYISLEVGLLSYVMSRE